MFETLTEILDKLKGSNKVWVRGFLVNTLNREGNEFWYQLREPSGLKMGNASSQVFLQFKAAGWQRAMDYIDKLNKSQSQYKYVVDGNVSIDCPKVDHTVYPPCPGK